MQDIMKSLNIELFGVCEMPPEDKLIPCRAAERLPQDAKRIVICAFPYYTGDYDFNISRYAAVQDYHIVVMDMLKKASDMLQKCFGGVFEPFADISPVPEVYAAASAGLGVIGKNGLLLTEKYGSFVFLGELVTNIELELTGDKPEYCVNCGRCKAACPSKALGEKFDKSICLSEITQKKGELSRREQELIAKAGSLWGCDICQNVCPYNSSPALSNISEFYKGVISNLEYDDIERLYKSRAFGFRGTKPLYRNYNLIYGDKKRF